MLIFIGTYLNLDQKNLRRILPLETRALSFTSNTKGGVKYALEEDN